MSHFALYCQFRHSLGHFARSKLIAEELLSRPGCKVSLIFGGRRPQNLAIDSRIEVLDLPEAGGSGDGIPRGALLASRSQAISEALSRGKVSAVLVDYLPLGLGGELMEPLLNSPDEVRWVWGLPYPGREKKRPANPRVRRALKRYDLALFYTSPGFLDPAPSYQHFGLPERSVYVGVITPPVQTPRPSAPPMVVGLAGAGIGAMAIFEQLLAACLPMLEKGRIRLRLVAGIFHQASEVLEKAKATPGVEVYEQGSAEAMTADASVVVARCGYNTAFSLIQTPLPLVFMPWHSPDPAYTEQKDRARKFSELPAVWQIDETAPDSVAQLRTALQACLDVGPVTRSLPFSTDGAVQTARELEGLR